MQLNRLCAPAMLYVVFSITQIIIDIFKSLYNTAFLKFIVMIVFTVALNLLCQMGLGVVSWFIVFVPFIMMTIITSLLLFVMGLSPSKGHNRVKVDHPDLDHDKAHHHRGEDRNHNEERIHRREPASRRRNQVPYDGYDTDGSDMLEYHNIRKVHINSKM